MSSKGMKEFERSKRGGKDQGSDFGKKKLLRSGKSSGHGTMDVRFPEFGAGDTVARLEQTISELRQLLDEANQKLSKRDGERTAGWDAQNSVAGVLNFCGVAVGKEAKAKAFTVVGMMSTLGLSYARILETGLIIGMALRNITPEMVTQLVNGEGGFAIEVANGDSLQRVANIVFLKLVFGENVLIEEVIP